MTAVRHQQDEDCIGHIVDESCTVCGVYHGGPCTVCGGNGFHRHGCCESDCDCGKCGDHFARDAAPAVTP